MRVGVVGINHKLADLILREALNRACHKHFHPDNQSPAFWDTTHAFTLLSTCNRTEVYFSSEDLAETHCYLLNILRDEVQQDFEHKLYSYFDYDCFSHIARVTAGLDSAIVGETEIQGQVKTAYEAAAQRTKLSPALHYMFQKSLKIGKLIRSKLQLGRGMPDVEHAVLNAGIQQFGDVWQVPILVVGASAINEKILSFLCRKSIKRITVCNRTQKRAKELAAKWDIDILPWKQLPSHWHRYPWTIVGTKSPEPVLYRSHLPHNDTAPKLVVDLSVPRNVEPAIKKAKSCTLLNIDNINSLVKHREKGMHHTLLMAEMLVRTETRRLLQIFHNKERSKHLQLVNS